MLFLFRSAPEVEKRIHSKLFRNFLEEPGYKRAGLHYCTESRGFAFQQFLSFVMLFHCICVARGWWRGVLYWLNVDFVTDALEIPTPNIIRWLITKYSHTININTSTGLLWRGVYSHVLRDWSCTQRKSTSDSPLVVMRRFSISAQSSVV